MVKIRSFKGFLANKDKADKVISPAYDTLNTEEARRMAEGNAASFLHVNKPEIDLPTDTDPYSQEVYNQGRDALKDFIATGNLVQHSESTMYIYEQTMHNHSQQGIMALASIEDYETNKIKRHEFTLPKKELDRTRLTDIQNANVGPVFLTFQERQQEIKDRMSVITSKDAYASVSCEDGVKHTVWCCSTEDAEFFQETFGEIQALYVADGHHRTAAAYNVGKMRRDKAIQEGQEVTGEEPFNFFMTLLYPADNLYVMDYNRVFKTLNGMTSTEFLESIKEKGFEVAELTPEQDPKPTQTHCFSLLIDGTWFSMQLTQDKIDMSSPVSCLDSQILTDLILTPILGITDVKNDTRIDFVGGIRGIGELEDRCAKDCVAAIAMYPNTIEELIAVADANLIMPPKSTWFEPKPRSGFIVRCFDSD